MLEFDAETTRILDTAYLGTDFTRRRQASFDALDPRPGETILDLGCGPGHLTQELARAVGPKGVVIGVDPSAEMRKTAEARCADTPSVRIIEGTADAHPLKDSSVDKAVSVQVFEYLSDLDRPIAELHRTLRPGGLVVISDMHWDTLTWRSSDPDRMGRVISAWDDHLSDRTVPEKLPALFARAGFTRIRSVPYPICDIVLRPDGLARMMMILIEAFAKANSLMPEYEIDAWRDEQTALAAEGEFFFSITHFVTVAERQ
jgi:SAM-dependent methyltransferase